MSRHVRTIHGLFHNYVGDAHLSSSLFFLGLDSRLSFSNAAGVTLMCIHEVEVTLYLTGCGLTNGDLRR